MRVLLPLTHSSKKIDDRSSTVDFKFSWCDVSHWVSSGDEEVVVPRPSEEFDDRFEIVLGVDSAANDQELLSGELVALVLDNGERIFPQIAVKLNLDVVDLIWETSSVIV